MARAEQMTGSSALLFLQWFAALGRCEVLAVCDAWTFLSCIKPQSQRWKDCLTQPQKISATHSSPRTAVSPSLTPALTPLTLIVTHFPDNSSFILLVLATHPCSYLFLDCLSLSPPFVASISTYLAHLDTKVHWCGTLVAKVVAKLCGKKLEFDGWEGTSEGLEWARMMQGWQFDWVVKPFLTTHCKWFVCSPISWKMHTSLHHTLPNLHTVHCICQ